MTEAEKEAIISHIDSLTDQWWEAWKKFDWKEGVSFVHDLPETTWVGGGPSTLNSLSEIRDTWPKVVEGLGKQEMNFTNAKTIVLAPDIVWTLREADFSVFDKKDVVVAEGQFQETAVWVKRAGEWKLLIGHDDDCTPRT